TGLDLPMYWYGWIVTSAIGASVAGAIASLIPDQWAQRLWSGWSWAIPMAVILAFCYLLRGYFIRQDARPASGPCNAVHRAAEEGSGMKLVIGRSGRIAVRALGLLSVTAAPGWPGGSNDAGPDDHQDNGPSYSGFVQDRGG